MTHSTRWSGTSAPCRLDWRPSRWLAAGLLLLALLAPLSILASDMPATPARVLAALTLGGGLWLVRRERRRAPVAVVWPAGPGEARIDGEAGMDATLHWRGPLAFMRWHDREGRARHLAWWPDTLPRARRRELRLAEAARVAAPSPASMAP